jgi:hypothetical protein
MHSNKQKVHGNVSFRMTLILALVRFGGTQQELASARKSASSSPPQLQSGDKLQGYVHKMAQLTKHRHQLTKSKRTTERPARKTLAA